MSDEPRRVMAKGGHKIHLLPEGTRIALCGHEPAHQTARTMARRGGWWLLNDQTKAVTCDGCRKAAEPKPVDTSMEALERHIRSGL